MWRGGRVSSLHGVGMWCILEYLVDSHVCALGEVCLGRILSSSVNSSLAMFVGIATLYIEDVSMGRLDAKMTIYFCPAPCPRCT